MENLDTIIPVQESYLVEFKDFSGGISVKEFSQTLCAFANTDGGDFYLGVIDQRQIIGLKVTASLLDQLQNAAREACVPPVAISLRQKLLKENFLEKVGSGPATKYRKKLKSLGKN